MDNALGAAFRAALYRFDAPEGELLLQVDEPNAALSRLLQSSDAASMAVLTAFNPQAVRHDDRVNLESQERLRRELAARGFTAVQGRNEDANGEWLEDSFLVPGISLRDANALE
jgi:hypothetical protein